jgi:predicted Ser/Thr protein kinase
MSTLLMTTTGDPIREAWDPLEERQARDRLVSALFGRTETAAALDRYELGRKLGEGGNGVVYLAQDPQLERPVAIKLVRNPGGSTGDAEMMRLIREARALAQLSHPNVLTVFDVGRYETSDSIGVFIATEYIEGRTLGQWLEQQRSWQQIVDVMVEAALGLIAAHDAGLVHRDFKPSNVMVGDDGRVHVLDFGLARQAEELQNGAETHCDHVMMSTSEERLTHTGCVVGTPAYMAPEQLYGGVADARSDQYSFCVALYEALDGARPFNSALERGRAEIPAMRRRDLPRPLESLIRRGLSLDPTERFEDMRALLAELERARRPRWGTMALVAITAVAAVGVTMTASDFSQEQPAVASVSNGDPMCSAPIDSLWNPVVAQRLYDGFLATGVPQATDTAKAVDAALDDFALSWASMSSEVAGIEDPDEAAAVCRCLRAQRDAVEVLLDGWSDPNRAVVEAAVYEADAAVGDPESCRAP